MVQIITPSEISTKLRLMLLALLFFIPLSFVAQENSGSSNQQLKRTGEIESYRKHHLQSLIISNIEKRINQDKINFSNSTVNRLDDFLSKFMGGSKHGKHHGRPFCVVPIQKTDSLILVSLYKCTNGDDWYDNTNWLTDSVYKWKGITLDESGRVIGIDLRDNNLTGKLPLTIGGLTKLKFLYLHRNSISGKIPVTMGLLNELMALYLSNNQFTGKIPPVLGNMKQLIWMGLASNNLTGKIPVTLGQLPNLEFMDLSKNQLCGNIPSQLGDLTKLTGLYLEMNNLTGQIPVELGNLSNLEQLALYRNELTGTIPAELGNLVNLKQLYLHSNMLTGEIPDELSNLTELQYFYLSSNQLTGAFPVWVCQLTELKELFFAHNALTGEIPSDIKNLKKLELFGLSYNEMSGVIPDEIGELSAIEGLYLSDNKFEGAIPATMGQLTGLKELWLSSNNFTGEVPEKLNNLTNLNSLMLSANQLSVLYDLSALPLDSAFYIQQNKLDFGDLETANVMWDDIPRHSYSPQAAVPLEMTESAGMVVFSVDVEGTNNEYKWFRDGTELSGENDDMLKVQRTDGGEYYCEISNPDFPELILYSEKKTIETYKVTFKVTDGANVVPNATVSLKGYGDVVTDVCGLAVFDNVAPENDIAYNVSATGFSDASGTVSVVDADVAVEVELSVPTGIDPDVNAGTYIYPNPTNGKINIASGGLINEVQVYNLTGKLLITKTGSDINGTIDLSGLEKGIYMLTIQTDKGIFTKKIIKR